MTSVQSLAKQIRQMDERITRLAESIRKVSATYEALVQVIQDLPFSEEE